MYGELEIQGSKNAVLPLMAAGILCSMPLREKILSRLGKSAHWLSCLGALMVLVLCIIKMAAGNFAPSIYAQF